MSRFESNPSLKYTFASNGVLLVLLALAVIYIIVEAAKIVDFI